MSSIITLPKDVTPVYLEISQWHGKRVLKSEYLELDYELDKELAHLGNVSMIKPELLKKFRNLSNTAVAALSKYGVRFGDGFIIPNVKHAEVMSQLKKVQEEWYETKAEIISRYQIHLLRWASEAEAKRKGFGQIIKDNAFSVDYIDSQIQFEIRTAQDMVSGLEKTLIDEVAERFTDKQEQLIKRKHEKGHFAINRRDLIVLRDVQDKLLVNAMLSDKALPLVDFIEAILEKVPDDLKESLSNEFCDDYVQAISMLAKPQLIFGMSNVKPKDDSQGSLLPNAPLNVIQQPSLSAETETTSNTYIPQIEEISVEETPSKEIQEVEETDTNNDDSHDAFSILDDF
ncbi:MULTISPECIES: DUF3150 domain-containing protein [Photobacterium]|uniref:DUF3150 domain-containing protein n=1 Tax=Photobacterium carnosum TaxID=2023717 RepID=A0A2N4UPP4_9GAMM|nr:MULTISPECIES: DUF3150 domain-containing protein [Photobacterium]MBY3789006.1 DUF3150 domain-containing protein [Photobacterium carnosum]MCD9463369.1 DUF3150 domain-containing protein [Photobacterium phosphoreum]MCD9480118.1 DUF3150 domain-containing protein [Photobacterium phosphoreum]MCD9502241.1 DUF3150 domain-containing protein [Photobacterium phosphoreum]MCD9512464.1 DUF3150 domain-containing protein [Photobacterium phosphoreum]